MYQGQPRTRQTQRLGKKNSLAEPQGQEGRSHPPNARPAIFMATEAPPKVPRIYRALNLEAQHEAPAEEGASREMGAERKGRQGQRRRWVGWKNRELVG